MKIITILELLHESKKYNDCINYLVTIKFTKKLSSYWTTNTGDGHYIFLLLFKWFKGGRNQLMIWGFTEFRTNKKIKIW